MATDSQIRDVDFKHLLERLPDAVVFIDEAGREIHCNNAYSRLPENMREFIRDVDPDNLPLVGRNSFEGYELNLVSNDKGFAALVTQVEREQSLADYTLAAIVSAMKETDNIYAATAKAITECIGWGWVAVTQFLGDGKVEVLALWDHDHLSENFIYDIVGTPCRLMAESRRFTFFSDLDDVFNEHAMIQAMGAKAYAGLVYYGPDNKPLGHIMAFHDDREVDYNYTREVFSIACLTLSSHMLLNQTTVNLRAAELEASTDSLTSIGNRKAFDDHLRELQRTDTDKQTTPLLAIIDLDGLKTLNDNNGHEEGDRFIKLFATELSIIGRQGDLSFRLGGDEFAVIFYQTTPAFIRVLKGRFEKAIRRVAVTMSRPVGASVGFALLDEAEGDVRQWFKLADDRMYKEKKSKRKAAA